MSPLFGLRLRYNSCRHERAAQHSTALCSTHSTPRLFRFRTIILLLIVLFQSVHQYRKYRSLGTPPRLTFQARLLHNQEDVNTERNVYGKLSTNLSKTALLGIGTLLVVEQSSLESQSINSINRGCAKIVNTDIIYGTNTILLVVSKAQQEE